MKFSLSIPIAHVSADGEFQNMDAVRTLAAVIEESGAAACGLTDHPAPDADWLHNDPQGHDALDPITALAFVAAVTTRLKLFTGVYILPYRNPFLSAKSAATLQVLSGGRLIFGVGAGYQAGEFEAMGVPFNKRGALMDEALETIRLAWAGGAVVKKGANFDARGNEPRPVPNPAPPIWIGGGSEKAVERAARWGDGWVPHLTVRTNNPDLGPGSVSSVAELAAKIGRVKEHRASLGKSGPFDFCLPLPIGMEGRTAAQARKYCDLLGELAPIGIGWASVSLPHQDIAGFCDNVRWFGEEVIARFA